MQIAPRVPADPPSVREGPNIPRGKPVCPPCVTACVHGPQRKGGSLQETKSPPQPPSNTLPKWKPYPGTVINALKPQRSENPTFH